MNQFAKWILFPKIIGIVAPLFILSCKEDEKPEFNRGAMLENMASGVIIPGYQYLKTYLADLKNEANNFIANPTVENLNKLKGAYINSTIGYQTVCMYSFGPAFDYDIKKSFNSFPCDTSIIESNISSGTYNLGAVSNALAIGFPAIDYLLYKQDEASTINAFSSTNRQNYLTDLIDKMITEIDYVLSGWNGNYKASFIAANGNDVASSCSYLLNEMVKDIELIKNAKVGIPSGQSTGGATLPNYVEAYYSGNSIMYCKENLRGLKTCFNGGLGLGFDDYIRDVEGGNVLPSLADNINNQFELCISKLEVLNNNLSVAVDSEPAEANALYLELKKLTVYCKTDLTSLLGILITYQDNDGD